MKNFILLKALWFPLRLTQESDLVVERLKSRFFRFVIQYRICIFSHLKTKRLSS